MQSKINILFVINPISGGKAKLQIPAIIDRYLDRNKFSPNFSFTEYVGHATEIADEALQKNFDVIVAAGGDGTINEVAKVVLKHQKILGILPLGSGNGLARFLNIPKNIRQAILNINQFNTDRIDSATFNGKHFFNLAGIGFDAHLSAAFSSDKKRGLAGYLKLGIREIFNYKVQRYKLEIDGETYVRNAFAISIANSSQYGNDVYIAPDASVRDGLLDVCIIKPFPLFKLPVLGYALLKGTVESSGLVEIIKGKNIKIYRDTAGPVHVDGEPLLMGQDIEVVIHPGSLEVLVP